MVAVAIAMVAGGIVLAGQLTDRAPSAEPQTRKAGFSIAPPKEVTPELIAMRACIEGVEHPTERNLTYAEQLQGCDTWVDLDDDKSLEAKISFRAGHLFRGPSTAHKELALKDYDFLIKNGSTVPHHYQKRAVLNLYQTEDLGAALGDIDKAIELTGDRGRPRYFLLRAAIKLGLVHETINAQGVSAIDETRLKDAEQDLDRALAADGFGIVSPKDVAHLKRWIADVRRAKSRKEGAPIKRG